MRPQDTAAAGGEIVDEPVMSNLDVVREALDQMARDELSVGQNGAAIVAFAALSAHEAEMRELVEAAQDYFFTVERVDPGVYDFTRLVAALRPFTGDEK